MAIRPEEFDIVAEPGGNSFPVQVTNVEYCGHDHIVDVQTLPGMKLIVRTTARCRVGDTVLLRIAPEKVLAYPDDGSLAP